MWPPREEWVDRARCRGLAVKQQSSQVFFPNREDEAKDAQALCFECPVRLECLDFAIRNRMDSGVWGGMLPSQRERERRRRRKTRSGYRDGLSDAAREVAEAIEVGM